MSKYHTPKIVWYQTDTTVIVRILLHDIKEYFLHVECDHLLFRYFKHLSNVKHYCLQD